MRKTAVCLLALTLALSLLPAEDRRPEKAVREAAPGTPVGGNGRACLPRRKLSRR